MTGLLLFNRVMLEQSSESSYEVIFQVPTVDAGQTKEVTAWHKVPCGKIIF